MFLCSRLLVNVENLRCKLHHLFALEVSDFNIIELTIFVIHIPSLKAATSLAIHTSLQGHAVAVASTRLTRVIAVVENGRHDKVRSLISRLSGSFLVPWKIACPVLAVFVIITTSMHPICQRICDLNVI